MAESAPEAELQRARAKALGLLSGRDRSVAETRVRLGLAGFTPEAIADTIAWLQQLGYLDDECFAGRYVAEKTRAGWAEGRVRAELIRRGVDRAIVDTCLRGHRSNDEALLEGGDPVLVLIGRRFARQWTQDPVATERRLAAFLARRGYDWESVSRIMREFRARQEQGSATEE